VCPALHDVPFDEALFSQRTRGMRAQVIHGQELAIDVEDSDVTPGVMQDSCLAVGDVPDRERIDVAHRSIFLIGLEQDAEGVSQKDCLVEEDVPARNLPTCVAATKDVGAPAREDLSGAVSPVRVHDEVAEDSEFVRR